MESDDRSPRTLLRQYGEIVQALYASGFAERINFTGSVGESIAHDVLGGERMAHRLPYDLLLSSGERVQVKTTAAGDVPKSVKSSDIADPSHFDWLCFLVLDPITYLVARAWRFSSDQVREHSQRGVNQRNGKPVLKFPLNSTTKMVGEDITDKFKRWSSIC